MANPPVVHLVGGATRAEGRASASRVRVVQNIGGRSLVLTEEKHILLMIISDNLSKCGLLTKKRLGPRVQVPASARAVENALQICTIGKDTSRRRQEQDGNATRNTKQTWKNNTMQLVVPAVPSLAACLTGTCQRSP